MSWYVTPDLQPVVWSTAVVNGTATTDIYTVGAPYGDPLLYLWKRAGSPVPQRMVDSAIASTSPGPVPTFPTPSAPTTGGSSGTGGLTQQQVDARISAAISGRLILVTVVTGAEPRPVGGPVAWATRSGLVPANAHPEDLVFTTSVPTSEPTPGTASEHTIYGGTAYAGQPIAVNADGTPSIVLATSFYRVTNATDGWRFKGGRVWIPNGAAAAGVPGTVTISCYRTALDTPVDLSQAPLTSKTAPVVDGQWSEARWDAPFVVAAAERMWVAYTFGDGHYLASSVNVSAAVQASDGSAVYVPGAGESGVSRSAFRIGTGATSGQQTLYGIDVIVDEG